MNPGKRQTLAKADIPVSATSELCTCLKIENVRNPVSYRNPRVRRPTADCSIPPGKPAALFPDGPDIVSKYRKTLTVTD